MDEYKSRLSTFLSDMVREELRKYDGGFTDEWNDQREKNAEVLGYKLSGTSDIKESRYNVKKAIKIAKKMGGNMTGAVKKIEKLQKGLSNQIEVEDALRKANESITEGGMGILSTDQADVLQGIVMRNKNKNTKAILSVALKSGYFKGVDKKELLGYIDGARQFVKYMKSHPMESINEKMGPEQYHKYMQYVFDTQFKTPEEKKMKKSIIKKINKGQKKKGLPLFKEERDYKAEYKKYGSSTKAKKYRAELNQYNRKKGTYGNGDGKDASHKGGKIAGFENQSVNRGRREKSRLKKEDIREFSGEQGIHVYLGGIVDAMRKAGLKVKTAKQMKWGFSKSRDKIGFFIEVEQRGFDRKEMITLQVEIDRDGNLWYLSGHRPMKLGKWADTSKIVRMWKALNKVKAFGQDAIFKKR